MFSICEPRTALAMIKFCPLVEEFEIVFPLPVFRVFFGKNVRDVEARVGHVSFNSGVRPPKPVTVDDVALEERQIFVIEITEHVCPFPITLDALL
jgi:hypothetical protein